MRKSLMSFMLVFGSSLKSFKKRVLRDNRTLEILRNMYYTDTFCERKFLHSFYLFCHQRRI